MSALPTPTRPEREIGEMGGELARLAVLSVGIRLAAWDDSGKRGLDWPNAGRGEGARCRFGETATLGVSSAEEDGTGESEPWDIPFASWRIPAQTRTRKAKMHFSLRLRSARCDASTLQGILPASASPAAVPGRARGSVPALLGESPSFLFSNFSLISSQSLPPAAPPERRENIYTLPNALTVSRIVACPVIGYYVLQGQLGMATGFLFVAGFTDLVSRRVLIVVLRSFSPT